MTSVGARCRPLKTFIVGWPRHIARVEKVVSWTSQSSGAPPPGGFGLLWFSVLFVTIASFFIIARFYLFAFWFR